MLFYEQAHRLRIHKRITLTKQAQNTAQRERQYISPFKTPPDRFQSINPVQRRRAREVRAVQGADRSTDYEVRRDAELDQFAEHADLHCAEAAAACKNECGACSACRVDAIHIHRASRAAGGPFAAHLAWQSALQPR